MRNRREGSVAAREALPSGVSIISDIWMGCQGFRGNISKRFPQASVLLCETAPAQGNPDHPASRNFLVRGAAFARDGKRWEPRKRFPPLRTEVLPAHLARPSRPMA